MGALLREDALPTAWHGEDPTHPTSPSPPFSCEARSGSDPLQARVGEVACTQYVPTIHTHRQAVKEPSQGPETMTVGGAGQAAAPGGLWKLQAGRQAGGQRGVGRGWPAEPLQASEAESIVI